MTLSGPFLPPVSGTAPKQLVVFLHGYGADGNDLIDLAQYFADILPNAAFTSPHAPFPCEMSPMGRQWFSLAVREPAPMLAGARAAAEILNDYLDVKLAELKITDKNLFLIGFSQGTMMALHTALRRPNPCAGIVGFSGRLIAPELLPAEIKSKPPVCLIHGDADMVVPFESLAHAEAALKAADVPIETHRRPGLGHGIDGPGIEAARKFLQGKF